ncbi:hypothetical protein [Teredinibacter sp. KSP-S5-2]|uniref:hypothetical protein n=1 Tax=Teredinibacter sp. KSP-S5-2 TaxID=3034506 RepID=UPI002934186E|nr:hypothetical protein [Teredinibacter sp. KSP-S5-2]WNO11629.1 hypothetical protein P5V12_10645 [Teredinibacter sp. KSP-S5-2]
MQKKLFLVCFLMVALCGCSTMSGVVGIFKSSSQVKSIKIVREDGANNNQYILVDVVFVYDKDVESSMLPVKAKDWFLQKDTYLSMSRKKLEVVFHQPVPLGILDDIKLPKKKKKSKRVMVYIAYYGNKKYFQEDITHMKHIQIDLALGDPVVKEI